MVLGWEEVKGAAQAAFDVWVSGGELQWAKGSVGEDGRGWAC